MQYNDGKYHVEFGYHNDRTDGAWFIVNTLGELCYDEVGTVCFTTEGHANDVCRDLNIVSEGGLITNLQ